MGEIDTNKPLTAKQGLVVAALATGSSWAEASTAAGVSETTIARWLKLEHVRDALQQQQSEAFTAASRAATHRMNQALLVVVELMNSSDTPGATRLAAARTVLDAAEKLYQATVIDRRITDLEGKIQTS